MEEGGRQGAGKEKKGGGRATRQPWECACAGLARCPGEGESGQLRGLELRPAVRDWGSRGVAGRFGAGSVLPLTGPFSPHPLRIAEGTGVLGQGARGGERLLS